MGFQRGIVLVLFVDEEPPRFGLMPVDLIHEAARFLSGFFRQLGENRRDIAIVPSLGHPRYCQNHHRALLA